MERDQPLANARFNLLHVEFQFSKIALLWTKNRIHRISAIVEFLKRQDYYITKRYSFLSKEISLRMHQLENHQLNFGTFTMKPYTCYISSYTYTYI